MKNKLNYEEPRAEVLEVQGESFICTSPGTENGNIIPGDELE